MLNPVAMAPSIKPINPIKGSNLSIAYIWYIELIPLMLSQNHEGYGIAISLKES
jgi:hypothetical protein